MCSEEVRLLYCDPTIEPSWRSSRFSRRMSLGSAFCGDSWIVGMTPKVGRSCCATKNGRLFDVSGWCKTGYKIGMFGSGRCSYCCSCCCFSRSCISYCLDACCWWNKAHFFLAWSFSCSRRVALACHSPTVAAVWPGIVTYAAGGVGNLLSTVHTTPHRSCCTIE